MPEPQEISWSVSAAHQDRSNDWYWTLGSIAAAGVVASIFFGNVLLAVIIGLGAFSIGVLASRDPREHMVTLDQRGLIVDGTRYPFQSIHSFWVEHETSHPRLFVSMQGVINSHFSFDLRDEAHGNEVRTFLRRFTEEEEQGPHIGERLTELLGL